MDYPDYADAVGRAVLDGRAERGLIVCGSGVGACIAANKLPGIRAGLCHDTYSAAQGVLHDDVNVLVLGARVIGPALAEALVTSFLAARFTNAERHVRRLNKVKALEARALMHSEPQSSRHERVRAAATAAARRRRGRRRRPGPRPTARRRLWAGDASLWTGADESRWLGWLSAPEDAAAAQAGARGVCRRSAGRRLHRRPAAGHGRIEPVPGGPGRDRSGRRPAAPRLHVLDSTDPAQVAAARAPRRRSHTTLVIVASKSGSTLEPNIFSAYFFARMVAAVGAAQAPRHFVAITDPGSKLEAAARRDGFRRIFSGVPSIGGRYSALSPFGLVPAAAMGLDLARWIGSARDDGDAACPVRLSSQSWRRRSAWCWGPAPGSGWTSSRPIVSPRIYDLGAWLEQLVAESTGKNGHAIVPVDREPLGPPAAYGPTACSSISGSRPRPTMPRTRPSRLSYLRGGPSCGIDVPDVYALAGEFFRWEIATAVAGAVMGINPFDQPDVEASKIETRKLTDDVEKTGHLPAETPSSRTARCALFTDAFNAELLSALADDASPAAWIRAQLERLEAGDYLALLAYVPMTGPHEQALTAHARGACATGVTSPPALASDRASSTRPARLTRAAPTPACSCRSRATTRRICRCPARAIPLAS